jgi:4-hydroxyacetophenone monooxygenase
VTARPELLEANDETIDDAVLYADPMVLRGLLHQLGDPTAAQTRVGTVVFAFMDAVGMPDEAEVAKLQAAAARFLKGYRDRGAPDLDIGPCERLPESLALTAGSAIPDTDVGLWLEQTGIDPWCRGLHWTDGRPPARAQDFRVAVIGAGMGGLNAAVHLKRAGVPCVVLEKNGEVGGTWHENRYPGARIDSPSRTYTHTYGVEFAYPNPFNEQAVNEKYFNWVADSFGVRELIRFHTEVRSVVWSEAAGLWEITVDGPEGRDVVRANAVISAVGFLARPNLPSFPGAESFRGPAFHTARWPRDLDLTGKRVAVVGTGCTGYQMIPELVKLAGHVTIFQRTPNWCWEVPGYLDPYPDQVGWLDRNLPFYSHFARFRASWLFSPEVIGKTWSIDPDYPDQDAGSALLARARDERIEFIRSKLGDRPELMAAMIPPSRPMAARPVLIDPEYSIYDVLRRDDVTLVSGDIAAIRPSGVEAADGSFHEADVIVYATGFKANDFLWPMDVRGRDGVSIGELWEPDGARAYLGTMLPGFPNFFMVYGPNTNPTGGLNVIDVEEIVTRFALECIRGLLEGELSTVDVTRDAYTRYNRELDRWEARKAYKDSRAANYYQNEHGRSPGNCPIDGGWMWNWLRSPVTPSPDAPERADLKPWFGADLTAK